MKVSIFPLKTISKIAALVVASALTVTPCIFKFTGPTARTNDDPTVLLATAILIVGVITMRSLPPQQPIPGETYPGPVDQLYPPPLSCVHPHYLHISHTEIGEFGQG